MVLKFSAADIVLLSAAAATAQEPTTQNCAVTDSTCVTESQPWPGTPVGSAVGDIVLWGDDIWQLIGVTNDGASFHIRWADKPSSRQTGSVTVWFMVDHSANRTVPYRTQLRLIEIRCYNSWYADIQQTRHWANGRQETDRSRLPLDGYYAVPGSIAIDMVRMACHP